MMNRLTKEPMLPAAVLAVLLFFASQWLDDNNSGDMRFIHVQEGQIHATLVDFERRYQRLPNDAEYQALIDNFIREEVKYRTALEMGLDQDDQVIKRHLRQKLEFVSASFADIEEPGEEDLQAYLDANTERFTLPDLFSFEQIFFDPRRRGEQAQADAKAAMVQLQQDHSEVNKLGDRSNIKREMSDLTLEEIERLFGVQAMRAMEKHDDGVWFGPVRAPQGYYLFRIDRLRPGQQLTLDHAYSYILDNWNNAQSEQLNDAAYQSYLDGYRVRIDPYLQETSDD